MMTLTDIAEIGHSKLLAYLVRSGWERVEWPRQDVGLFNLGENQIALPLIVELGDYQKRIHEALLNLAKAEDRKPEEVITEFLRGPSDVLRFRMVADDLRGGTIPFTAGFEVLEGAKRLLLAAATDQVQPEAYHPRMGHKAALQFLEHCRLGQTEVGSFIASVICPLVTLTGKNTAEALSGMSSREELEGSFTRKVTSHLMQSLYQVHHLSLMGEVNRIVDENANYKISGNLLEELLSLISAGEFKEFQVGMGWSRYANHVSNLPRSVTFDNSFVPVLEHLVRQLKPKHTHKEDTFVGQIVNLRAQPDATQRNGGEIVLHFLEAGEDRATNATVELTVEDYGRAIAAHTTGAHVRVTGILRKEGRTCHIEYTQFGVIS